MYNRNHPWIKYKDLRDLYGKQIKQLSNVDMNREYVSRYKCSTTELTSMTRKNKVDKFMESFDAVFMDEFEKSNGYPLSLTRETEAWKAKLEELQAEAEAEKKAKEEEAANEVTAETEVDDEGEENTDTDSD